MLRQRLLTALVLGVLMVWAVLALPGPWFALLLLVPIVLGAWEWAALADLKDLLRIAYTLGVVALSLLAWPLLDSRPALGVLLAGTALFWCLVLVWLGRYSRGQAPTQDPQRAWQLSGPVVLAVPWLALVALREDFGPGYVLFLLMLVWVADSGAYFVGRRFGQRRLVPAVSPGKTWEGVYGGLAAAALFALLGAAVLGVPTAQWPLFIVVSLVSVMFSIVGDLLESLLKRLKGVKDSGSLLPGHGGMLDRVDSLTAAAPIFVLGVVGGL
ncbi:MAG: phosphatidate cytidylyltransferase [Candidatus Competibacteraceae bacterium]|nr:phosphatidate cytidylyltransferase [Candidatus Competibacteraceae bacterium]